MTSDEIKQEYQTVDDSEIPVIFTDDFIYWS